MSSEEKKKSPWSEFESFIENANRLAGLGAAVIAYLTFAEGNHIASYGFVVIVCISLNVFLWRLTRRRPIDQPAPLVTDEPGRAVLRPPRYSLQRAVGFGSMVVVTVAALGWIGVNAAADLQKAQGFLFKPANPGELLVILAQFDKRGGTGLDPTTRIAERLGKQFDDAKIQNYRIEIAPVVCGKEVPPKACDDKARRIGDIHQAIFVIWGWYDEKGFRPYFTITSQRTGRVAEPNLSLVSTDLQDYINDTLPAQMSYFATFTLGQVYYWEYKDDEALTTFDLAVNQLEAMRTSPGVNVPTGADILYTERALMYLEDKSEYPKALADLNLAIQLNPKYDKAYRFLGYTYHSEGKYDAAIQAYNQAIALNSDSIHALTGRGQAYQAQGDLEKARADFNHAIQIAPKDASDYIGRGYAYLLRGQVNDDPSDFDRAIADYNQSIERDPDAYTYFRRGLVFANKRNLDAAIADYTTAIKLSDNYPLSYQARGDAYRNRKKGQGDLGQLVADLTQGNFSEVQKDWARSDLDRAISDYTKAIELNLKYIDAYNGRGDVYSDQHQYDLALTDYNKAIQLDPKYALAYSNRGGVYYDQKQYDLALADYNKAIELDPNNALAYNRRGNVYREQGKLDLALSDYYKAIELDPKNALAYNGRGNVYREQGKLDLALSDYDKAIGLDPTLPDAYNNRGIIFADQKQYARALADYDKAIKLRPNYVEAFTNRGNAYEDQGNYEKALADFDKAIEINPNYENAYYNRALASGAKGDLDQAIADNTRALELNPKDAYAYNNRGWAYYLKKNLDLAIPNFTKSIELDSQNANAYVNRGRAYREQGLKPQAISDFEKYLQLAPNASDRAQVEGWLRELKGQ